MRSTYSCKNDDPVRPESSDFRSGDCHSDGAVEARRHILGRCTSFTAANVDARLHLALRGDRRRNASCRFVVEHLLACHSVANAIRRFATLTETRNWLRFRVTDFDHAHGRGLRRYRWHAKTLWHHNLKWARRRSNPEAITGEENDAGDQMPSWEEVFLYFLFLGFVNIGGPVAQITMMFNHMVEKRRWLSKDRFVKIMAFCHLFPGPEALQLAIYIGYLKRKFWGGIVAGITFILPGAIAMIVLSWLYVKYGKLHQVTDALYILKPAVLGIIAAGIIKLGRAAIRNFFLVILLVGAFVGMRFAGINFLLILMPYWDPINTVTYPSAGTMKRFRCRDEHQQ
jgi:chromate transport protein ChrA